MQRRQTDRKRYFEEQARTTKNYYIPYITQTFGHIPATVLEVGCGEGGNLLPFAKLGCRVVGVDISESRIRQAQTYFAEKSQEGTFIASDVFELKARENTFSLILVHDVIEHIEQKAVLLDRLKHYLSADGVMFVAFPAWQMPFGGHQQIAHSSVISHFPFLHLLPRGLYGWLLKLCGENEAIINELLSIKRTKCTIEMFRKTAQCAGYIIAGEQLYFINPHYETKFGLSPRKLNRMVSKIPYLRSFFSTTCFYILKHDTE